jgi:hypothetical protein
MCGRPKVENVVIHRRIEQHAATRGDVPAIIDGLGTVTYRVLNHRANAVARQLIKHGFRRGNHASVAMPHRAEAAAVLLGILKAGGSYGWLPVAGARTPVAFAERPGGRIHASVDLTQAVALPSRPGPNLPVLVRGWDIACVLGEGAQAVLVPHETIATLGWPDSSPITWAGDPGAFDLWAGLMAGVTVAIERPLVVYAAAA